MTKKTPTPPPSSVAAWQARAIHTITCPSGQAVKIRIPGIATLLEHGDLPDELVELALLELSHRRGAAEGLQEQLATATEDSRAAIVENIRRYGTFQRRLVVAALVEPQLTFEQVSDGTLPEDDLAMIAEIVQRFRAHDAKGVRIGVEPLDRWAAFHEAHGLPTENCPGCDRLLERLSTADLGAV